MGKGQGVLVSRVGSGAWLWDGVGWGDGGAGTGLGGVVSRVG